jgi:hypothetical protein
MYLGQAEQDKFVLNVLKNKKNGYFLEIGSNHPIDINNSYLLEKNYNWKGIMVEYDSKFLSLYKQHRPNSIHVINDATKVDYKNIFEKNNMPLNFDYLQIDLEANNGSTLKTLQKLDNEIFDTYKFLSKDKSNTKMSSSELLAKYIQIDNGNYYTNLLKSLLIPLMTPNNLTDLLAKPKIDEMTELGNEIVSHKQRLKEIQDEINALRSSIVSTGGTQTTSTDYKRLGREETNEQAEITSKEKKLKIHCSEFQQ